MWKSWINQVQSRMQKWKIRVEITSAGPWKSKLFYWLFFSIVLVLPCRVFLLCIFFLNGIWWYIRKAPKISGQHSLWLARGRANFDIVLSNYRRDFHGLPSKRYLPPFLSESRQGCRQGNKGISVFLEIGARDAYIGRNCLGSICPYPDFSLPGTGRDVVNPSLENFWGTHRAWTSLVSQLNQPKGYEQQCFAW